MYALLLLADADASLGSPEFWTKLLTIYGPAAILVLFVFVIERRAWSRVKEPNVPKSIGVSIYSAVWLCILGSAVAVGYFYSLDHGQEMVIKGNLSGLTDNDVLTGTSADDSPAKLWVSRLKSTPQVYWRIISQGRLHDTNALFYVVSNGDFWEYQLPVTYDRYSTGVPIRLRYNRDTRELDEVTNQATVQLVGERVLALALPPRRFLRWFDQSVVHAQAAKSVQDLKLQLDSADPFARIQARSEFARLGQGAVPYLQEILQDLQSSYQLRLGAIVALNRIQGLPADSLSAVANCQIAKAVQDNDPVIREEASVYMKKHPLLRIQDDCIPSTSLFCSSPLISVTLSKKEAYPFEVDASSIIVYFAKDNIRLGKPDSAELVVLRPPKDSSRVDLKRVDETLKTLSIVTEGVLAPGQYDRQEVQRGDVVKLKLTSGYQFSYRVQRVGAVRHTAELKLCK